MRNFAVTLALATAVMASSAGHALAETAIFAGGCFWCVESDMDHVKGVKDTISGYAGGTAQAPTYDNHEGYTEAVKIEFDPAVISYESLTAHFLRTIDVTDGEGQFCDRGQSYIPALFPLDAEQKAKATRALDDAGKALKQPIAVKLSDNPSFFPAEDYHQNYYLGTGRVLTRFGYVKQSDAYKRYREGCGRDARVKEVWGSAAYSYPVAPGSGS
jgi:peptide-methionine (S)-S-oxide reductase